MTVRDSYIEKHLGITSVYFNGRKLNENEYTIMGRRTILLHFPEPKSTVQIIRPPWWAFWRKPKRIHLPPKRNTIAVEVKGQDRLCPMYNIFYEGYKHEWSQSS